MANKFISSVWDFEEAGKTETGYLTHDFLRWYGKLIPQLVERVIQLYSQPGDKVLANFSGSGTVAFEAVMLGRSALGTDVNPLSLLLSRVKSDPSAFDLTWAKKYFSNPGAIPSLTDVLFEDHQFAKWFHKEDMHTLAYLRNLIEEVPDSRQKDLFRVALASIVKKVSRVDARCVNHLVTDSNKKRTPVFEEFISRLESMHSKISLMPDMGALPRAEILFGSAGDLPVADNSIDLIISHPPYLGHIDYSNMYQLENKLLGFDQITFKGLDISSNSLEKYLESMKVVFDEMYRVAKVGARIAVVIGDNRKNSFIQPTFAYFIHDAAIRLRLPVEDIFIWRTRAKAGMSLARRGNHIDHNYVLVFKKV